MPEQPKEGKVALIEQAQGILGKMEFRSRKHPYTTKPKSKVAKGVGDNAAEEWEYSPCSKDKHAVRRMARRYAFYLTGKTEYAFYLTGKTDTKLKSGEYLFSRRIWGKKELTESHYLRNRINGQTTYFIYRIGHFLMKVWNGWKETSRTKFDISNVVQTEKIHGGDGYHTFISTNFRAKEMEQLMEAVGAAVNEVTQPLLVPLGIALAKAADKIFKEDVQPYYKCMAVNREQLRKGHPLSSEFNSHYDIIDADKDNPMVTMIYSHIAEMCWGYTQIAAKERTPSDALYASLYEMFAYWENAENRDSCFKAQESWQLAKCAD